MQATLGKEGKRNKSEKKLCFSSRTEEEKTLLTVE